VQTDSWPAKEMNDRGNAERLVARYADRLRYLEDGKGSGWAVYDNVTGLWSIRNVDNRAAGLMARVLEEMVTKEAGSYSATPPKEGVASPRQVFVKWARTQGSSKAVSNGLALARGKRKLFAKLADFDAAPNLLHCTNGVLDLRTLELLQHSPDYMMTLTTGVALREGARSEMWEDYLRTFVPDMALRRWVQKALGYSLLDGNPERLFIIVKGPTSTGKTTLNEMVMKALGKYAGPYDLSLLRAAHEEKPSPGMATALPRRYIGGEEASQEWHLHADHVKKVTGGVTLQGRHIYEGMIERQPGFVPWMFTNAMPTIENRDEAFDMRLRVVPFTTAVKTKRARKAEQMRGSVACREAVLEWMVAGLDMYLEEGLDDIPPVMGRATEQAKKETSTLDVFIGSKCKTGPELWSRPVDLEDAYMTWCDYSNVKERDRLDRNKFGANLEARGFRKIKQSRTQDPMRPWVRVGLALAE
jgi:P4 family phage/plasmid primase-like protien